MPTFITIFGMRFFFYSGEHLPIHLHIENGDGKAKIQVDPDIKVVENLGIKQKDIRKALAVIKLYRDDIISMWNEYFDDNGKDN